MLTHPKITIVVPIYKAEKYLDKCIQSLQAQTLKDIEIILVDDGSPDKSGQIAEAYAKTDCRISVIHQRNNGVSSARNVGIKVAKGEYIGFVDSDDWVDKDMYEQMYTEAYLTHADVVTTGIKTVQNGVTIAEDAQLKAGSVLRGAKDIFRLRSGLYGALPCHDLDAGVVVSACTAIYKRSLLKQKNIHFMVQTISEDTLFNISVLKAASVVAVLDGTPYNYRKDSQNSRTTTFHHSTPQAFFHFFTALQRLSNIEPMQFRPEACLRTQRGIIDSTRFLAEMIEASSQSSYDKNVLINLIFQNKYVRRACEGYPFWKLKINQMIFFLCIRFNMILLARLLLIVHLMNSGR